MPQIIKWHADSAYWHHRRATMLFSLPPPFKKTEIISKILLFAENSKIKDPSILNQL